MRFRMGTEGEEDKEEDKRGPESRGIMYSRNESGYKEVSMYGIDGSTTTCLSFPLTKKLELRPLSGRAGRSSVVWTWVELFK